MLHQNHIIMDIDTGGKNEHFEINIKSLESAVNISSNGR